MNERESYHDELSELEIKFKTLEELDAFTLSLAEVMSQREDVKPAEVGYRTLIGSLKGHPMPSERLKTWAREHGFHGKLRNIDVEQIEPDYSLLPRGLRGCGADRVQSLGVRAEMHSTGRGFIGYQNTVITLYVPPEGFFNEIYNTEGTPRSYYEDAGEPIVLISSRPLRSGESIRAIDLLRTGSEQISVWMRRFALARTATNSYGQSTGRKVPFLGAH